VAIYYGYVYPILDCFHFVSLLTRKVLWLGQEQEWLRTGT